MTITVTSHGVQTKSASSTDVVFPSFTPAAGSMLLLIAGGGGTLTINGITGHTGGAAWTQVKDIPGWSTANRDFKAWACFVGGSPSASAVTIDINYVDTGVFELFELSGVDTSGTVTNAFGVDGSEYGYDLEPWTATLAAFSAATNMTFCVGIQVDATPTFTWDGNLTTGTLRQLGSWAQQCAWVDSEDNTVAFNSENFKNGFIWATEIKAAAGSTLPTGRADETDTALGLTRRKAKAAQLATETDTALALTAAHARATGLASETDSALALAKLKAKATGLASETETALALVRVKAKPVGLATETDNALAVSAVKTRSTGRADETDTALALGEPAGVGLATETDSALSLARVKAKAVEVATTTETALALTARKVRLCGTAAETDTALGLAAQKIRACGRADESDTALARPPLGVIVRPVGLAIETDEALALEPAQREEEAATGGWARYFRAEQEALRRTRFRALDEEADETREREALAEALETALIADGTATQGDVDRLRLDQIAALYTDRTLLDRRAQRALAYAERSRTELATRLALRELQRQQEDEELAVLLVLAID